MYPVYCSDKCLKYILDMEKKKKNNTSKNTNIIINNQPPKTNKSENSNNCVNNIQQDNLIFNAKKYDILEKNTKDEPKVWFNLSLFKKYFY